MIFSSTVSHASEICTHLPEGDFRVVLGDTEIAERDEIIEDFKQKKFKYLVNVSVLSLQALMLLMLMSLQFFAQRNL